MLAFRILLITLILAITAYTGIALVNYGPTLFSVFVENLTALNWSGQFNLDFSCYLMLSALWLGWRHEFSSAGLIMVPIAAIFGIMFFAPYLLWASIDSRGNATELLLGKARAARLAN